MRGKFERSAGGAAALLAALLTICLIAPAEAGGSAPSAERGARSSNAPCSQTAEGCTRIRGHIPAASERAGVETMGDRSASFGSAQAPFVSGLDAAGQAAADVVNRLFFLQVSHDDSSR